MYSKQPNSTDEKSVKHVATKRTSPKVKVPPSNAKDVTSKEKGPIANINNSGSKEKGPIVAAEVSSPRQKASSATSKGRSLIETSYPTTTNSLRQREKGPSDTLFLCRRRFHWLSVIGPGDLG